MRAPSTQRGFTATEIMIVVAILGILAALAAPNLSSMIRTQRVKTAAFDVISSLNLARSEAIKRNRTVRISPAGDWTRGWEVTDASGNVIKHQSGWNDLVLTGPGDVTFTATGRVSGGLVQFNLSATDVAARRCITLDASGRAGSKEGSC